MEHIVSSKNGHSNAVARRPAQDHVELRDLLAHYALEWLRNRDQAFVEDFLKSTKSGAESFETRFAEVESDHRSALHVLKVLATLDDADSTLVSVSGKKCDDCDRLRADHLRSNDLALEQRSTLIAQKDRALAALETMYDHYRALSDAYLEVERLYVAQLTTHIEAEKSEISRLHEVAEYIGRSSLWKTKLALLGFVRFATPWRRK